jgi:DHA2 family multidrug resistance protein
MGQQFAVPPIVTLTLGALPPARLRQASGLFNLMRNLGGALGIAFCATLLNSRTNLHFHHLAEHLTGASEATTDLLAQLARRLPDLDPTVATQAALRQLWQLTLREALTMTFSDIYLVIMVCFALTTISVPLLRKVAPPKAPSADAH